MLKGLETLELRCNAQAESAIEIAAGLNDHPKLSRVIYPFLPDHPQFELAEAQMTRGGTVFSIEFKNGKDAAFRFLNALGIVRISNNLGDAKSLVTHPSTTTHQRLSPEQRRELGITDGIVRVSIGLEDVRDLTRDIESALDAA